MFSEENRIEQPSPPTTPTTTPPRRSWGKWIKRGIVVAIFGGLIALQWPMLKGVIYGIVPPAAVPADQLPQWRESYAAALAESKQTGRPVLIDFTASWCPPCRVMEADVWPDEGVRAAIAERVVPLQIDVDDPASAGASQRYGVQFIPTIVLVDGDGNELVRGGFMSAGQMIDFVNTHAPTPTPTPAPTPPDDGDAVATAQ